MANPIDPKRGEIWLADLEPTRGDEMRKARPVVIPSRAGIGRLRLRIVVPITDWNDRYAGYPWMVRLDASAENGLTKVSAADGFQVRSLSVSRLVHSVGAVTRAEVTSIVDAVALCIGFGLDRGP